MKRSFADAKQLHGHRYARMRGLVNVQEQSLLSAVTRNIKKIALLLSGTDADMPSSTHSTLLSLYLRLVWLVPAR